MIPEKMIFIGGTGRSGTSWLQAWLKTHRQVFGPGGETDLMSHLAWYTHKDPFGEEVVSKKWTYHIGVDKREFLHMAGQFVFDIYARKHAPGRTILLEKTPRNIYFTEEITEMMSQFCPVYIIHPYRDGRNYLESAIRSGWQGHSSAMAMAQRWVKLMKKMIDGKFGDNVLHVKYEDLVTDQRYCRKILKFCDICHSDIVPHQRMVAPSSIPFYDENRWKLHAKDPKIKECYDMMTPILEELGYSV